ncbi:FAD-binding domain-containing protein [Lentithecium fluviatile CBS 122367]|uniref:FAD-binding domain-containing protein n=1 Tax=Lentithecium fluviatile CBS 122367 TaxID=1168545 RepID=A0A6G1IV61_9PLEO|nr:FAD-binding domain-containing protein [Lentithecium fluviatile CBS 122367]
MPAGSLHYETKKTLQICTRLKSRLHSQIVLPAEEAFEALRTANWDQVTWKKPACIATPNCTESVQQMVQLLVDANASFAVRSGGHSPSPGASNIENGVLIDISRISEISLDTTQNLVRISPGVRWRDVHSILSPNNVTVVAPRVLDVGVGGSILGGGISYLSERYGLACDNAVEFEVVLANGNVVTANATSHRDLFWALKGGGNNFGIITKITTRTHPISMVWGGYRVYAADQLPAVLSAFATYQDTVDDPDANLLLSIPLSNLTRSGFILNLVYFRPLVEPAALRAFSNIPHVVDMTKVQRYEELLGSAPLPDLPRWGFRATSFSANDSLYHEILNDTFRAPELGAFSNITGGTFVFNMQPISRRIFQYGREGVGNPLGIRDVKQLWGAFSTGWWSADDDAQAHTLTKALVVRVETLTRRSGQHLDYLFMNDADWDQKVLQSYGDKSLSRLRQVNYKYDPTAVFQRLVRGGFKLESA